LRVLVTGATGCTGGALARELVRRGHDVHAIVRSARRCDKLLSIGVSLFEGDIRNADEVSRAADGVDLIYHLAAVFRTARHPDQYYYEVNVGGVENVINVAQKYNVSRIVHCSTVGVHGHVRNIPANENAPYNPGDIYQVTKVEGEKVAQNAFATGVPGVIVRPAAIYGPGDLRFLKLFRSIQKHRWVTFGTGKTLYHLIYIDDLVEGLILCGEHPKALGKTFILAGEKYITLRELVRCVAEALGVRPPPARLPLWPLMAAAEMCEGVCRIVGVEPPLHRRRADFFRNDRAFSIDRARTELGFEPKVGVVEGIQQTAAWYRKEGLLS
jgi:dihydroflavonol-4-reductase